MHDEKKSRLDNEVVFCLGIKRKYIILFLHHACSHAPYVFIIQHIVSLVKREELEEKVPACRMHHMVWMRDEMIVS